ncbi:MAG: hypothetical protein SPL64_00215 [Bacteroidaceae bacterium]|nr:hypothetical protein [Bacteroidaceae bacterium]
MAQFDERLNALSFPYDLDNILIICDDTDPLQFAVKINGTTILETTLYPDSSETVNVSDLSEFILENIQPEHVADVGFWLDGVFEDGTTVIPSKADIDSGADSFCLTHYLSLLKGTKPTYIGTDEYLSFYTTTEEIPSVSCLWINPDTGATQEAAGSVAMRTHHGSGLYTIRVVPGNFQRPDAGFILHSFKVTVGTREQDYILHTPTDCEPLTLKFQNNFGVHENFHFFGTYEKELKPTRNTASFGGKTRNYKVEAVPTWKCNTGILSEAVQPLFADLCAATKVWREDNAQEVTITENEHKISNDRYEIKRGTLTFRESKRTTLHKPLEQGATFDQTFDNTFD